MEDNLYFIYKHFLLIRDTNVSKVVIRTGFPVISILCYILSHLIFTNFNLHKFVGNLFMYFFFFEIVINYLYLIEDHKLKNLRHYLVELYYPKDLVNDSISNYIKNRSKNLIYLGYVLSVTSLLAALLLLNIVTNEKHDSVKELYGYLNQHNPLLKHLFKAVSIFYTPPILVVFLKTPFLTMYFCEHTKFIIHIFKWRFHELIVGKDNPKDNFALLVKEHVEIQKFISKLNESFKYIVLIAYSNLTFAGLVTITPLFLLDGTLFSVLFFVAYLLIFACMIYCGESLSSEIDSIFDMMYLTNWYDWDRESKKMLLFVLMETGKNNFFVFSNSIGLNNNSAVAILRTLYSFTAIIYKLRNRWMNL